MLVGGRYVTDKDSVFQGKVFSYEIAQCKGVKHPFLQFIFIYIFRILNVIQIASGPLAGNDYSELAENLVFPTVECGSAQWLVVAQVFVALPLPGNFFK